METKVRMLEIKAEHLALQLVAVELIAGNVRKITYVSLAVVLEVAILSPGGLPIKPQVVFHEVLAQEVFFQVQHFREVISAQLHRGFANFLMRRRNLRALVEQKNPLVGVEQKLPR